MGCKKKQSTNTEYRVTIAQTLDAPNKKTVYDNIKHGNHKYEGCEKIEI